MSIVARLPNCPVIAKGGICQANAKPHLLGCGSIVARASGLRLPQEADCLSPRARVRARHIYYVSFPPYLAITAAVTLFCSSSEACGETGAIFRALVTLPLWV